MTESMTMLAVADPEVAAEVRADLEKAGLDPSSPMVKTMAGDVIYGLSLATSLGRALAGGYIRMMKAGADEEKIRRYGRLVRRESRDNTTSAEILAGSLDAVLTWGDGALVDDFLRAAGLLKGKWLYALSPEPLRVVAEIIGPEGIDAGRAWIGFLADVLKHDLTYNQFRRFSGVFPKAVGRWPADKRGWRINQLRRVVGRDFNLTCLFAEALEKDLSLLDDEGLASFVSEGLRRYAKDEIRGARFLGLDTQSAVETCHRLRATGVLSLNRRRLSAYLQARSGRPVPVQPISAISGSYGIRLPDNVLVCSDGRTLFLADEIDRFDGHQRNDFLYKALAWFEGGVLEFGTFDFDLEVLGKLCPEGFRPLADSVGPTDMDRFCQTFTDPRLAQDLLTVFEYGRLRTLLEKAYPAGARRYLPVLREEAETMLRSTVPGSLTTVLFALIALNADISPFRCSHQQTDVVQRIEDIFNRYTAGARKVEASALGVIQVFNALAPDAFSDRRGGLALNAPFGLGLRPELYHAAFAAVEQQAATVKEKIFRLSGVSLLKSALRRRLTEIGTLSLEDVRQLIYDTRRMDDASQDKDGRLMLSVDIDADELYRHTGIGPSLTDDFGSQTFRYHEWDHFIGDYLADHVLVRHRTLAAGNPDFYQAALSRHSGLIKKIRYAFELLKPEEIAVLRKWREGEDFDYRQLLEYAIDKKSGRTPSERIYLKRLKRQRDVAVLLLLDFSRSTSNKVAGSDETMVLDVEKEALVLFCEALSVTGDIFAIAGFSGTGRLGVDYFQVKSFDEPVKGEVEGRIGRISPQRNTRMGAAVRHAAYQFAGINAKTKLLIIITDGFPNDIDYKRDYALADTRRALLEARTRGIMVHSITVNIAGDNRLDDLYGRIRHSVINDVQELPDRLIRLYGRLTG